MDENLDEIIQTNDMDRTSSQKTSEDSIGDNEVRLDDSNTSDPKSSFSIMRVKGEGGEIQEVNVYESLVGVKANTLEELEAVYRRHSILMGFCVRKFTTRRTRENVLTARYYVCSYEGEKAEKKATPTLPPQNNRKRKECYVTRTGCKARMWIKVDADGMFIVHDHHMPHNHQLNKPEWSYLQCSERRIDEGKGKAIIAMEDSGLRPADGYRYMVNDAGGEEIVGHSMQDHLNFVNRLRMKQVEYGDAQKLVEMLTEREANEEGFFFMALRGEKDDLRALFWRDSMMLEDFKIYGDVLVFDTTYRTNKYNLVCAPFVGLNNHRMNVMFACAFISDETAETFVWLLNTFKKSMEKREPVTIFTDQDLAMAKAIDEVFPSTRHRLCLWHLKQNAMSHIGNMRHDSEFAVAFNKCLMFCTDETEFEKEWNDMITKYQLHDHSWFNRIYSLREKWCTALSKDYFSARTLSSQRSESTNAAISFNATKTTNLVRFYGIFNATLRAWRSKEVAKEFYCIKARQKEEEDGPALLKHAANIYTHRLFKDFKLQWDQGMASAAYLDSFDGNSSMFRVIHNNSTTSFTVMYTKPTTDRQPEVICSCNHFEEVNFLCSHCLRVLHLNNEAAIPDEYIASRWTKLAKMELWNKMNVTEENASQVLLPRDKIPWRLDMTRKYYNLVLKSEGNLEARRILEESFDKDSAAITAITSTEETGPSQSSTLTLAAPTIRDPEHARTKGRKSKRVKSAVEGGRSSTNEFGTKSPNPHLF